MHEFKLLKGYKRYWITRTGSKLPIVDMPARHIYNIINCLNGEGKSIIPNPYHGLSNRQWKTIFINELRKRMNATR